MEPAVALAVFVRNLQATFGDRALEVAEAQRDAALDNAVRTAWAQIVQLLRIENAG